MNTRPKITDYASFLQAKQQLKEEVDRHRLSIKEELKEGARNIKVVKLMTGLTEKIMDSKLGRQVSNALSVVNFIKDLFGKKNHEPEN